LEGGLDMAEKVVHFRRRRKLQSLPSCQTTRIIRQLPARIRHFTNHAPNAAR
jgi:hypothetical protein